MRFRIGTIILLLAVCLSAFAADGTTVVWRDNGWDLTTTLTHPGTLAGTEITLTGSATYYDYAGIQYESKSEPLILTVGKATIKREWTTDQSLPSWAQIDKAATSGPGGCEILADGKFRTWVEAENNGQPVTLTCRIRYHPP
jgi:hypothetical protein